MIRSDKGADRVAGMHEIHRVSRLNKAHVKQHSFWIWAGQFKDFGSSAARCKRGKAGGVDCSAVEIRQGKRVGGAVGNPVVPAV